MKIEILQTKGVLELLLFLKDKFEGKQKIEMRMESGLTINASVKGFNILLKNGFLKMIKKKKGKELYTLNKKGLEIALKLQEALVLIDALDENFLEFHYED